MSQHLNQTEYRRIPKPQTNEKLLKVKIKHLRPTQICVGFAEVWNRIKDFKYDKEEKRLLYLQSKPVPIVKNINNDLWMLDRHHRLSALISINEEAEAYCYIVEQIEARDRLTSLNFLMKRGWLYLYNSKGIGPESPGSLPHNLKGMQDDPYRSLVWRLKKEGFIRREPFIPYHEFNWSSWLRTRSLPPFSSNNLNPALPAARKLVTSQSASHIKGWQGEKN